MQFKVGDKVVCLKNHLFENNLIKGKTYTISYIHFNKLNNNEIMYGIDNLFEYFSKQLFELDILYSRKMKILNIKNRINVKEKPITTQHINSRII